MAGLYADVPGHRFAYDLDGTVVQYSLNGATPVVVDPTLLNDEATDGTSTGRGGGETGTAIVAFAFPEARTITGLWAMETRADGNSAFVSGYQTSTDTTDGINGTWSAVTAMSAASGVSPGSRNGILTVSAAGVTGLQIINSKVSTFVRAYTLTAVHIYGTISTALNTDRLDFWHPTLNQQIDKAHLDWGDIPQGTVMVKQFRIKNLSATKSATAVVVAANNSAGGETLLATGLTFSLDNVTYTSTVDIGNLAAGATSATIYIKRTVSAADPAAIRFARITATPTTFA